MIDWLPDVERVAWNRDGGSHVGGPWRFVIHRTEGYGVDQSIATYRSRGVWPHLTADIRPGQLRLVQHGPFTVAASAMKNLPGGVETNRRQAIQIEVVGFTDRPFGDEDWHWLGTKVAPCFADGQINAASTFRRWVDASDGFVARPDAPQRMTFDEWASFNAICGHQHVPENDHYDPGKIDIAAFIAGINQEDDMTPIEVRTIIREELAKACAQGGVIYNCAGTTTKRQLHTQLVDKVLRKPKKSIAERAKALLGRGE